MHIRRVIECLYICCLTTSAFVNAEADAVVDPSDVAHDEAAIGSHAVMRREEAYKLDAADTTDVDRRFDDWPRTRHGRRPGVHGSSALSRAEEEPVLGLSSSHLEIGEHIGWTPPVLDADGSGSAFAELQQVPATTAAPVAAAAAAVTTTAVAAAAAGTTTPVAAAAAAPTTTGNDTNGTANDTNATTDAITAKGAATSILLGAGITVVFLAGVYLVLMFGKKGTTAGEGGAGGGGRSDAPRESSASRLAPRSYRQQRGGSTINGEAPGAPVDSNVPSGADEPARPSTAASGYQSRRQQRSIVQKEEEASF